MNHIAQLITVALLAYASGFLLGLALYRGEIGPRAHQPGEHHSSRRRGGQRLMERLLGFVGMGAAGLMVAGVLLGCILLVYVLFMLGIGRLPGQRY